MNPTAGQELSSPALAAPAHHFLAVDQIFPPHEQSWPLVRSTHVPHPQPRAFPQHAVFTLISLLSSSFYPLLTSTVESCLVFLWSYMICTQVLHPPYLIWWLLSFYLQEYRTHCSNHWNSPKNQGWNLYLFASHGACNSVFLWLRCSSIA